MKQHNSRLIIFLIILFHAVGLMGFLIPGLNDLFIQLVPFHLLLMMALILFSRGRMDRDFLVFMGVCYLAGFLIELAGVKTGLIFGRYHYGATLGVKLADIPLMIGVNWVLLIYCAGAGLTFLPVANKLYLSLVGALLLLLLDVLIEPVAIRFDYWNWAGNTIPVRNYIAWFSFAFIMLRFFHFRSPEKYNPAALALLLSQFVFFAVLNLWGR